MADSTAHYIFMGYDAVLTTGSQVFKLDFRIFSGAYQIRLRQNNDANSVSSSNWVTISDAPHYIEIYWWAASAAGANDGGITLWVDGTQSGSLSGLDNDLRRIELVELGAPSGVDVTTSGVYFMDAFESHRQTYIGP
jgi:hypothetical protein